MDEELEILDSTHLSQLEPEVMKALAGRVHVFARVSPANKLQIVQALQSAGKVIGMTGDGINDGPALKAADIGIALGHTGTDVAREVADVVLEDDDLETMVVAISQGRTIYNNLRKSVRYMISKNTSRDHDHVHLSCRGNGSAVQRHAASLDQHDLRHLPRHSPCPGAT